MAITVVSTTDSAEAVNQAAVAVEGDTLVAPAAHDGRPAGGGSETAEHVVTKNVHSTTDTKEQVDEVQADIDAQKEERRAEYLGRGARKRIDKLTRERYQNRAEIEELRSRLSRYEGHEAPPNGEAQPQSSGAEAQPQSSGAEEQPQGASTREQMKQEYEHGLREFEAQVTLPYRRKLAEQKYPDLNQSLSGAKGELPMWALNALMSNVDGYDVAYYLSKHADLADRVHEATKAQDNKLVGDVLDWISNGLRNGQLTNSPPPRPSNGHAAPPPLRPVGGGSNSSTYKDPGAMSMKEYNEWRNKGGGRR